MYDELFSRFTQEFKSSIEDPDIRLSYTDRQRMKGGEYTEVADEKRATLDRRIWWLRVYAAVAAVLLGGGAVLTAVSDMGVGAGWTLEDVSVPLFIALCMGFVALVGMGRLLKLEKQRLLCELVIASSEHRAPDEKKREAA